MTKKIAWQDIFSLPKYGKHQVFLNNTLKYTYAPGVLSSVLQSFVNRNFYVSIHPSGLVGQVYHLMHKTSARLAFVASRDVPAPLAMESLLSQLCQQAGKMGALRVLVEVEKGTNLADNLRRAGFTTYAEQQVWRFSEVERSSDLPTWEVASSSDLGGIHTLYQKLVPSEVKRIEPPPTAADLLGVVYRFEGEIVGYAASRFGPKGALLDILLDPAQNKTQAHLTAIYQALPLTRLQKNNMYVRVRTYQQKLASALALLEASPCPTQLVMVKHLSIHYQVKPAFNISALEKQPDVSTPFINSESKP